MFPLPFLLAATLPARLDSPAELKALKGVSRILVLGDSITYAGGYVEVLDEYLTRRYPDRHYIVIDAGLPSENLSGLTEPNHADGAFPRPDLHERLDRALAQTKPDLVLACYGMNDGIYYPAAPERAAKFQDSVRWLRDKVKAAGARFWLVTPPVFDPEPIRSHTLPAGRNTYPSGQPFVHYDDVLAGYARWELSLRRQGWQVIDIHAPLKAYLEERRRTEPGFAYAGDGVHPNETGHRIIAREILKAWGAPTDTLPAPEPPSGEKDPVAERIRERQRLLKDAWLTAIGHKRPGMPQGLPLDEARKHAAELDQAIREALPGR